MVSPTALYAAFDRYPAGKGAAIHIRHFAGTLFDYAGGGLLTTLGDQRLPARQLEDGVEILRFCQPIPNFLDRTVAFGRWLEGELVPRAESLRLAHFRDPWSGVVATHVLGRRTPLVYEINGLPSIELPHRYPGLTERTIAKLRRLETACWEAAARIVVPARAIRDNLVRLGVPRERIVVIHNGAELPGPVPPPSAAPPRYLLYFGAIQRWQGVDVLLRAFARLADFPDLHLVICAAAKPRHAKGLRKLAERLEIAPRVVWLYQLDDAALAPWRQHALLSVAPLTDCPRNLDQGCCPLKILESMAAGVPVVASDLPAATELIDDGVEGRLVRPDRPAELARAIRLLVDYPDRRLAMGEAARRRVAAEFTWTRATERLRELYRELAPDAEHAAKEGNDECG